MVMDAPIPMPTDVLTLHQLFSPAFPTGAFAWSHGLETAVHEGAVTHAASLQAWLEDVLCFGAGWSDAVLCAHAAQGGDVRHLSELAYAVSPSAERRLETQEQGAAFARTARSVWKVDIPDAPMPVAAGAALRALKLPRDEGVALYLHAFAANLCAAGIRLIPLGQTEGQAVTHALADLCRELARKAADASLEDLGGFAPALDIFSQQHEALQVRLFRS